MIIILDIGNLCEYPANTLNAFAVKAVNSEQYMSEWVDGLMGE